MLNAIEFLEAKEKMCNSYSYCADCPLGIHKALNTSCGEFIFQNSKVVELVEDWLEKEEYNEENK